MINEVKLFHELAGSKAPEKVGDEFWEVVKNQAARVLEEAQEMFIATNDKNLLEVLDGVVDVLFTTVRMNQLLTSVGVDLEGACEAVCENNLTKFTQDESVARASVHHYQQKNPEEVFYYKMVEVNGSVYYPVLREMDNKLLKPLGYESVNLLPYLEGVHYEQV